MKVYEKLGLPYLTKDQYVSLDEICKDYREGVMECPEEYKGCQDCVYDYLMSDVPVKKVKRWEIYNGDFFKAQTEFNNLCKEEYSENGCMLYGGLR